MKAFDIKSNVLIYLLGLSNKLSRNRRSADTRFRHLYRP